MKELKSIKKTLLEYLEMINADIELNKELKSEFGVFRNEVRKEEIEFVIRLIDIKLKD